MGRWSYVKDAWQKLDLPGIEKDPWGWAYKQGKRLYQESANRVYGRPGMNEAKNLLNWRRSGQGNKRGRTVSMRRRILQQMRQRAKRGKSEYERRRGRKPPVGYKARRGGDEPTGGWYVGWKGKTGPMATWSSFGNRRRYGKRKR